MRRLPALLALVAVVALVPACLISRQVGEHEQVVTFHFDTALDWSLVAGRSLALLVLAFWIWKSKTKGQWTLVAVVAAPLVAYAAYLAAIGYCTIAGYRLVVGASDFVMEVPPESPRRLAWTEIEEMRLSGVRYEGKGYIDLPEWETMELVTTGGVTISLDVGRLSVEHRQILADLISSRCRAAPVALIAAPRNSVRRVGDEAGPDNFAGEVRQRFGLPAPFRAAFPPFAAGAVIPSSLRRYSPV